MKTPVELEDLTLDQLYVMWLDVETLKEGSTIQEMSADSAFAAGILASHKSLFQLAMEKKAAGLMCGLSKKQRRQLRRERLIKLRESEPCQAAEHS